MSLFGLMWSNLFRKRTRTTLTILSVMVAFLLFMLLRAISSAFEGGVFISGAYRLVTGAKYSLIESLPYSQRSQIEAIPGVEIVTHSSWFGGIYQDPKNFFAQFPVEPDLYFEVYDQYTIEPEGALERFRQERTAALVDIGLIERFGWKVGDVIPIIGAIFSKKDGSDLWEFEIVGTYSENGEASGFPVMLFNYDYFYEAAAFGQGLVGQWSIKVSDTERINEIASEIDALFENSPNPTRTQTEDEAGREFAKQLGDIGFITTMIMAAVFFTIILLTGNTMAQGLRERIPELAVLKTLGFTDRTVSWLVLGEALLLILFGGGLGVALAMIVAPALSEGFQGFVGSFEITARVTLEAIALMLVTGVLIGLVPALTANRLAIVDALRKH